MDLINKRIIVTGGDGFLGHHLVPLLKEKSRFVTIIHHNEFDLLKDDHVSQMYAIFQPEIVIHLAAKVGGIQYNQANPASLFHDNLKMGVNVIHQGKLFGVQKMVILGTVCSYPVNPKIPFQETDLWNGYPELTNAAYGISKKSLLTMCQAYRTQYGFNAIYLMPVNLFGEFDEFNEMQAHVIPMLIKKFVEATEKNLESVEVWGSGLATREFMYAGDAAKAILLATEKYEKPEPLNIGSGQEISVLKLAELIKELVGFKGEIVLNKSMPDGQPRRVLDISRMKAELGFGNDLTLLKDGLKNTIDWYKENR
jgi:GDP-L-fucose synthase